MVHLIQICKYIHSKKKRKTVPNYAVGKHPATLLQSQNQNLQALANLRCLSDRVAVIASQMQLVSLAVTSAPGPSAVSSQFRFTTVSVSNLPCCRHAAALFPVPTCVLTRCLLVEIRFFFYYYYCRCSCHRCDLAHLKALKNIICKKIHSLCAGCKFIALCPTVVFQAAPSSCTSQTAAPASTITAFPNTPCGWRTVSSRLYLNTPRRSLSSALATRLGMRFSFRSDAPTHTRTNAFFFFFFFTFL